MVERRAVQVEAKPTEWSPIVVGDGPILIICDSPSPEAFADNRPMSKEQMRFFADAARPLDLTRDDFTFVSLCPVLPLQILKSSAKKWDHVKPCVEPIMTLIAERQPRMVVMMGELASRVVLGRAVKVTKARGVPLLHATLDIPVMTVLSPGYVMRIPDASPAFVADMGTIARVKAANYRMADLVVTDTHYQWVTDFERVRTQIGQVIAVDTETTGLRWYDPDVRVLTVQFTPRPGISWIFPVDEEYCAKWFPEFSNEDRLALIECIKEVLENGSVRKVGHNIKFDHMMFRKMGIDVKGWLHDTQLMAFCVDENMLRKDLDECVRIWVPEMSGYADLFSQHVDKSRMLDVPPENISDESQTIVQYGMRHYAGGDTDATYRLARALDPLMKKDKRQQICYRKIMMPAIMVFANSIERHGMAIDVDALNRMEADLRVYTAAKYRELIRMVPAKVRLKHMDKGLRFTRAAFIIDTLFSKDGFGLKPCMYTDSTKDLDDDKKVPASGKDHLTYFVNHRNKTIANFCTGLIQLGAAEKMLSTYVGSEEDETGFHQYISHDGNIYPSYMLHRTNTGRSASAAPNGQNFPKRSPKGGPDWATQYQGIFKARPGWKLVNCDLSQIELRLVAWMAQEPTMLRIYREGGDIHTMTLFDIVGITQEQWAVMSEKERKEARTKAKAVNFGFIYDMAAPGFQVYAKTDYGIDLTLRQAEQLRDRYFGKYRGLRPWHGTMKKFAHDRGYVRALHGAVRHLPSIYSKDRGIVSQAERQAINAPIQRFGSDLGLIAMIRFTSQMDPDLFRIVGFVHDALIMECREGYEEQGAAYLKWCMETPPLPRWFDIDSPIPILAECDIATGQTLPR
jgi:DNA polymerase I-like protein with 3'-5' exonuclease and polymerase domains